jgi:N6-adenosine-specific RNA methylase IME4
MTAKSAKSAIPVEVRPVGGLRPHPQADTVPLLAEDAYQMLKADIGFRGLQAPLDVTGEGVVLDGRVRLRAARELGLKEVPVRVVAPRNELEHMLRAALLRRQLSASQRAALALKLLPFEEIRQKAQQRQQANLLSEPERAILPAPGERSRDLIANLASTAARTAQDVITVYDHDPALFEQVLHGDLAAHTAASKTRRALRDAAIPAAPPLPEGPFELILADPPWSFGTPDSEFAPEQHYPTMSIAEIRSLRLPAAENCVLFLWAVNSLLPEALEVIRAWGFSYRACAVWVKPSIGPGVWLRQRHEPLLIASKGTVSPPDPDERCDSVLEAKRGRHSQKPEQSYRRIETMYPTKTKLELFARGTPRPGWAGWGNQTDPPTTTPKKRRRP